MQQNTTSTWSGARAEGSPRLRVLIESADPALAISDFAQFARAGIDVAVCGGPVDSPTECPLVRGEPCVLAAEADAILFTPGAHEGRVLDAARRHHGGTAILLHAELAVGADVPQGCEVLSATASVEGQISAVRRAALAGRRRQSTSRS